MNDELLPLTARQREIYLWIAGYCVRGYGPTFREVSAAMGMRSMVGAASQLEALRKKGWVTWLPGANRTMKPTEAAVRAMESEHVVA